MSIESLLAFNLALLVAIASPGPALLMAIRTTLVQGRAAGIAIGCGLGTMAATWTLAALLGLEVLFQLFPWAYLAMKIAGALYLLWIAWRTWQSATKPLDDSSRPGVKAFRDGLLVNLSNPKSVLFAAAVLVVIFPPDMSLFDKGIVVANHLLIELLFYTTLSLMMSDVAVSRQYLRAKRWFDRGAAVVLAALGLRLLFQR